MLAIVINLKIRSEIPAIHGLRSGPSEPARLVLVKQSLHTIQQYHDRPVKLPNLASESSETSAII